MSSNNSYMLGSEENSGKIYFLVFLLFTYLLMFFMWIGMNSTPQQKDTLWFYIAFGFILGIFPLAVDLFTRSKIELPLDTISYEGNSPVPFLNNPIIQIVISLVMGLLMWIRISVSGQALLKAPMFSINIPVISEILPKAGTYVGAFLSGICGGVVETIVFWGFCYPTLYNILRKQGLGEIEAVAATTLIIAIGFTTYHWFVYGYRITALITIFVLGVVWGLLVYVFRSVIPLIITHFVNNFAVVLFALMAYSLQVIL